MIESFIITFRETLEAALVVGIIYAYLKKTKRDQLNPYLYGGVSLAIVASIIGAVILQTLYQGQETRGQQIFEGSVMIVAAIFVTTMILWMWKSAKNLKTNLETGIDKAENKFAGIGILLFVFIMVFREGVETVLFLYAISFGSDLLSNLFGGAFGLGLAVIFGALISKGSLIVDLKKFFVVTGSLLLFLVVKLVAVAIHEFQEARLLMPASTGIFWDIQIWLASPTSDLITLLPIVVVPAVMIIFLAAKDKGISKDELKSRLFVKFLAGFLTIFVLLFTIGSIASQKEGYDPEPITITATNDELRIPISNITENITKYRYNYNGVNIRFFLVKGSDGKIKSALDACRICGPTGFEQIENTVVCKRCGVETEIDSIGQDESCNPIPLDFIIDSDDIVIYTKSFLKDMYIWTDY